jgi:hypothetical protein
MVERKILHTWDDGAGYRLVEGPQGLAVEYRNVERGPGAEFWVGMGPRGIEPLMAEVRRLAERVRELSA